MKKIEILLRKFILHTFLLLISRKNKKPTKIDRNTKILLIRLNRIGDALVTTPFITILKNSVSPHITVLADKNNYFIFNNCPSVDNVLIFQKGIKHFFALIKKLNNDRYDFIIDLHDDVSTTVSLLLTFLNSPNIIGLEKSNRSLYTHVVKRISSETFHVIDRNLEILKDLGIGYENSDCNIQYKVDDKVSNETKRFLDSCFTSNKFLLGINISAGSKARFWGVENYKKLLGNINKDKFNIILMCTPGDEYLAKKINVNDVPIFFSPKFEVFASMISNLDLLFTPDTSIVHIASAFNIPLFGLYVKYNTKNIIWYPYKSTYEAVVTEEPDFANLEYLTVENKFIPFLERIYNERNTRM